ncbi:ribonucleotide reductase of class Ia (aerobic), beta subunit [Synechococcus phage BUCT-ZZ01]|nr:ribonucleotide reductase of class Ia (aerobic), beta subunit [Synechococcus phage BUCT-ZZ01]
MTTKIIPHIQQPGGMEAEYPEILNFIEKQNSVFWTHKEIKIEKDIQDILVNMTEAERHAVIFNQKLFTKYEVIAGNEYWGGRFKRTYPRTEFQEMASCFSFFELCVHKRFYQALNEKLHLHTNEFYEDYVNDPVLKDRMEFIDKYVNDENDLLSVGVFALVEGAILYSSFAFFKHFQSEGKNKMKAFVSGIDFSAKDENIHHEAGAYTFRTHLKQMQLTPEQTEALYEKIYKAADALREHEHAICDKTFEKGRIEGITAHQLKNFVDSRLDLCLENLGLSARYKPHSNPIAEWFYLSLSNAKIHDFFASQGSQYNRNWAEDEFDWEYEPTEVTE